MATLSSGPTTQGSKKRKLTSAALCVAYRDGLPENEKYRYVEKLALIDGRDPYDISVWSSDESLLPAVTYRDIINYLVFSPSPYTAEDLRCYKGLEAYNQFVCGWVRDVAWCKINDLHVIVAKVRSVLRLPGKNLACEMYGFSYRGSMMVSEATY